MRRRARHLTIRDRILPDGSPQELSISRLSFASSAVDSIVTALTKSLEAPSTAISTRDRRSACSRQIDRLQNTSQLRTGCCEFALRRGDTQEGKDQNQAQDHVSAHKITSEKPVETWLAQSYLIFVQAALPNDNEIVRDCQLTLRAGAGTLAAMFTLLDSMMTTTMTATPNRAAVASS